LYALLPTSLILAQSRGDVASTSRSLELDWPQTVPEWGLFGAIGVAAAFLIWMYIRDTCTLSRAWTVWLSCLRLTLLGGLAVIALNPQERTQKLSYRPSQVVLLVDTSTSMQQPERDPRATGTGRVRTRAEAVRELLATSPLVEELRQRHNVDIYTFDSDLSDSRHRFATRFRPSRRDGSDPAVPGASTADAAPAETPLDWEGLLQPRGFSTRLGDSVDKLLAEVKGRTLSGVVVFSDGASNAGRDTRPANTRAKAGGTRLLAVGVGSAEPPVNLQIAKLTAPTDVQMSRAENVAVQPDPFELTGFVQFQGLAGRTVKVELLRKLAGDPDPVVVGAQELLLPDEGQPASVTFQQAPEEVGPAEYTLRVAPPVGIIESRDDDNSQTRTVNVFDRPLKVLMIAGGPMKDYVFARNTLHRHKSVQVDIWLQTGTVGISQDAHDILFSFPASREELFAYDVIMALDPDWSQIPDEGQAWLEEWVANEGGGLILVAGDVYTPQLAAADTDLQAVRKLYPVLLEEIAFTVGTAERADQPWRVGLTQEGRAAGFLQLAEEPALAAQVWEEFPGIFRCYPTRGRKGGTTVYAEFTNPLSRGKDGQPVLIAGQRYSQGHTLYVGSPEIWRLRSLSEDYYDRFWVKLVRKAAEGRAKRGLQRGMLILEGSDFDIGQTVPLRARVLTPQFQPLETDSIALEVYDPTGRPLVPAPVLTRDRNRPAEFVGDFRAALPGRYRLALPLPDSSERVTSEINVLLPALEVASLQQDVRTLETLVDGTGGKYLTLDQAAAELPALLPNLGEEFIIDEQLRELWDRQWVLFLLVGLLGVEWLTRKLLKLA
jgi:hypothetical protein